MSAYKKFVYFLTRDNNRKTHTILYLSQFSFNIQELRTEGVSHQTRQICRHLSAASLPGSWQWLSSDYISLICPDYLVSEGDVSAVWWPSDNLAEHGELPGQVQGDRDHREPGVWGPGVLGDMGGLGGAGDNRRPRLKVDNLGELAKCDIVAWVILQFRSPEKLECTKYVVIIFSFFCVTTDGPAPW